MRHVNVLSSQYKNKDLWSKEPTAAVCVGKLKDKVDCWALRQGKGAGTAMLLLMHEVTKAIWLHIISSAFPIKFYYQNN